ncbi:B3 domain-containing transcription factor VRN1 [Abeliophyllum distichum]|uniref:B3 domain-containing transcription factor VRN1 n=1 Tax=Abeliophyllum distichum TaxID=126358 RepID=A0ABD1SCW2_9LAMI
MWDMGRPHFILGFDPSLCCEKLNIPSKFIKHVEGSASGTASLVGPSGNTWYADFILLGDSLFFHDGWAAFVRDHFLEQGDTLVFRYDGDLHFTVQVFDKSLCEKESAFSAASSQDLSNYNSHVVKKRDRESFSFLDSIVVGIPKKIRSSQMHSECLIKNQENSIYRIDKEECLQEADSNSKSKNFVTVAVPSHAEVFNENSDQPTNRITKLDMLLSASEAERVVQSFTSSFPNFIKVMKRFNISGSYTLNVPYQFAMEHLPKCKVKIVLRNLKGESWTVNSIPTTKVQTSHTFCGGWLGFVRDNNIDVGDICIFELVRKYELHVRILHVGKEGIDGHVGEAFHEGNVNGSAGTSHKISRRKSKKISGLANSTKGSSLSSHICLGESDIQKKLGSLNKQGPHAKGCMSMKSAPEEKIAVQSFVSNFPHFVKSMKKFNISGSYTLKVPYQFSMDHLPNCRTEIVLRNLKGECWTVNSIPTTKVQTLHTFCGGWMAFVRDNDIQMGDICIFELIGKCEMRVHISGIGKKAIDGQNGANNYPMT